MTTCAIYTRISKDDDETGLAPERQLDDCRELAEERGWTDVVVYAEEPGTSATSDKVRPVFQRLLADIRAGRIGAVVAYEADRLTRKPSEAEEIITIHERAGMALATVGGTYDLSKAVGQRDWRNACVASAYETAKMKERVNRKLKANAMSGWPHGAVPFGWSERVYNKNDRGKVIGRYDLADAVETKIIKDAAEAVLENRPLRAIARDLNLAGRIGRNGQEWTAHLLRQVLLRPRNAGLVVLQGKVLDGIVGCWDPIRFDTDSEDGHETWTRVWDTLTAPERRSNVNKTARRHLLTGIAVCGSCGGRMTVLARGRTEARKYQPSSYICEVGHCVRRNQEAVDALISELMIERLSEEDALDALAQGDVAELAQARADIAAAEVKLAQAAEQFAEDVIDGGQLALISGRMRAKIAAAKARQELAQPANVPLGMTGENARERWEDAPLDVQRTLIGLFCLSITIEKAATRGRYSFDPSEIVIDWR